jgi:hypothetical protein
VKWGGHTGTYGLKLNGDMQIPLLGKDSVDLVNGYGKKSFHVDSGRNYVLRFWAKKTVTIPGDPKAQQGFNGSVQFVGPIGSSNQPIVVDARPVSALIEQWQQWEVLFTPPGNGRSTVVFLPGGYSYDDFKIVPVDGNSKGFVYHPITRKLMASLDENNFATFYEYDAGGNLIRTKKETDQGIITLNEARAGIPKKP